MKSLNLSVVDGDFVDKGACKSKRIFLPEPIALNLGDEKAVRRFFTSKVHSAWRYDGSRSKENTTALLAVPFDFDNGDVSFDEAVDRFRDYVGVVHTSTGHTEEHPKLRVILVLTKPITDRAAFKPICDWLREKYPDADRQVFKISQPLFPCCRYNDGETTIGFPLFKLKVLTGKPFAFPPEVLKTDSPPVDKNDWPDLDSHLSKYRKELYCRSLDLLLTEGVKEGKDGGRDNRAIVLASECRKCGHDIGEAGRLLSEWNGLNKPPLMLDDLKRIVKSAYTGKYDFGESDDAVKNARERVREDIKKGQPLYSDDDDDDDDDDLLDDNGDDDDMKMPPSLADLMKDPKLTERPKTVGSWISWRQRITLLVGSAKKSGKSTLCTYESLAVLNDGGTVLWVSNDEPLSDVARRFKEADINADAALHVFILHNEIPGIMPNSWKKLYQIIIAIDPDIVVLDSIHTLFPLFSKSGEVPESHATAAWQAETSRLRRAALSANAAVVWIHHENKSGTSAGSVGIEAAVDVIVHLQRSGGRNQNMRTLSFLGRFVGPSNNKVLQYMNETDGYKEIDLKDDDKENGHDSNIVEWILEQFNGNDEIKSIDMNKRIKTKYGKSPVTVRHVRHVATEFLGVLILSAGVPGGGGPPVMVWRMPPGADPSQFTEGDNND